MLSASLILRFVFISTFQPSVTENFFCWTYQWFAIQAKWISCNGWNVLWSRPRSMTFAIWTNSFWGLCNFVANMPPLASPFVSMSSAWCRISLARTQDILRIFLSLKIPMLNTSHICSRANESTSRQIIHFASTNNDRHACDLDVRMTGLNVHHISHENKKLGP